MTTKREEIAQLSLFVAKAIHKAAVDDEDWTDLTEEEQADFLLVAHAAMGAHDAWLKVAGYHIIKPTKMKGEKRLITPKRKLIGLN